MRISTRTMLDRAFVGTGIFSVALMTGALLVILGPIMVRGCGAFVFRATVEHRRFMAEQFSRGNIQALNAELSAAQRACQPVYDMIAQFETELALRSPAERRSYGSLLSELKEKVRAILGPLPGDQKPVLLRARYGQVRWDRAKAKLQDLLYVVQYDYSDTSRMGQKTYVPRVQQFKGTSLEPLFDYVEKNLDKMLLPRTTFYWRFLFDEPYDANFFGGIWPSVLGTLYLTVGAMLMAAPMGIISAIYLAEYAGHGRFISIIRTCISSLAGVPSIVLGLFGLAFFINTVKVSDSKSVLAGSLTLALLILPTIIHASEEAIRAVPNTYKEAALSLGASKWRTITRVVLPVATSGILTGIILSMGRAAGETAPIIFTAAVSLGKPIKLWEVFTQPTPALSWSVYNLCTEHQAVDEIRHVQYGMVLTLIVLVLFLNITAIILRGRIAKRLRG